MSGKIPVTAALVKKSRNARIALGINLSIAALVSVRHCQNLLLLGGVETFVVYLGKNNAV